MQACQTFRMKCRTLSLLVKTNTARNYKGWHHNKWHHPGAFEFPSVLSNRVHCFLPSVFNNESNTKWGISFSVVVEGYYTKLLDVNR